MRPPFANCFQKNGRARRQARRGGAPAGHDGPVGAAGLFKTEGPTPTERPAFPQLSNALYFEAIQQKLAVTTRQALDQAASPQEWNMLLLSAPEFMVH